MRLLAVPSGMCTRCAIWSAVRPPQYASTSASRWLSGSLPSASRDVLGVLRAVGDDLRLLLGARLLLAPDELQPVGGAAADLGLTPQVERTGAAHQAQVGAEIAAGRIERGGTAPQAQEHVLDDVLSERRITEHAVGGGIHLAVVVVEREAEGARLESDQSSQGTLYTLLKVLKHGR